MMKNFFGLFLMLHGLVHFLYLGLSQGYFYDENIHWSTKSWLWGVESSELVRKIAFILYLVSILVFVIGGLLFLLQLAYWRKLVLGGSIFSTLIIISFWDGNFKNLDDQGFIGVLINVGIIFLVSNMDRISTIKS